VNVGAREGTPADLAGVPPDLRRVVLHPPGPRMQLAMLSLVGARDPPVAVEQDQQKFLKLVDELNQLLEVGDQRLKDIRLQNQRLNEANEEKDK